MWGSGGERNIKQELLVFLKDPEREIRYTHTHTEIYIHIFFSLNLEGSIFQVGSELQTESTESE